MTLARRIAIAIAVIAGLGAAGLVCERVGARGRYALAYSTHGAGPEGTRGALLFAAERGMRPVRWAEDLGRIPRGATLIALGGCDQLASRPLSRIEAEHLVRWVEEGGTLIVAGAADYLPDALGVRMVAPSFEECLGESGLLGMIVRAAESAARDGGPSDGGVPSAGEGGGEPDELAGVPGRVARDPIGAAGELAPEEGPPPLVWARGVAPPLAGLEVGLRRPARLVVSGGTTLLAIDGEPAAVRLARGRGEVIAIASASALQNRDLAAARGAALLARLLEGRGETVLFDEYHLGAGERRTAMRYLAQSGAAPIVIQIAIVALLALAWRGARFGAPRAPAAAPVATTRSFVSAIGELFGRAGDPAGALAIVARDAIVRIATHHRQDSHDPERLAEALRALRRDAAADAVVAIARRARDARGARIDLVGETRAIDAEIARAIGDDTWKK